MRRHVVVALALAGVAIPAARAERVERIGRVVHRDPLAVPARGPAAAAVTIELFFVPTTAQQSRAPVFKLLEELQARHPSRIRLVWRVQRQGMLSTAALEAAAQGKFFELLDRLNGERLQLTRDALLKLVATIGLDPDRVASAIAEDRYAATFAETDRRAKRLHVPTQQAVALFNGAVVSLASVQGSGDPLRALETAYAAAYLRAQELLEQGVTLAELPAAFDARAIAAAASAVTPPPGTDDEDTHDQWLVSPPLRVAGLPSSGDDDARTQVVFLCPPHTGQCDRTIERALSIQKDLYPDLKIVWAPWFDVGADAPTAELAMYADAALCAEQLGAGAPPRSAGWLWVEAMARQFKSRRRLEVEQRIDLLAKELELDPRRLAACRARTAGASLGYIEAARASGVRVAPSTIVGGRIYVNLNDPDVLQSLIEAQYAPGISEDLRQHVGTWKR